MGLFDSIGGLLGGGDSGPSAMELYEQYGMKPLNVSTNSQQGAFSYQTDPTTGQATSSFTLSPEMRQAQGAFYGLGQNTMNYLTEQFNPEQYAQNYFTQLQGLRQPSEDMAYSRLRDRLNLTGREGFASGVGSAQGVQMNPEMAAFYNAQQQQRSQDALAADNQAFSRFNNLLSRAAGAYGTGMDFLNPLYREAEISRGYTSIDQQNQQQRSQQALQGAAADAYEEEDSFLDTLLGVGMNVGLGYLTGGTSAALTSGMGSLFSMGNSNTRAGPTGLGWNTNSSVTPF